MADWFTHGNHRITEGIFQKTIDDNELYSLIFGQIGALLAKHLLLSLKKYEEYPEIVFAKVDTEKEQNLQPHLVFVQSQPQ